MTEHKADQMCRRCRTGSSEKQKTIFHLALSVEVINNLPTALLTGAKAEAEMRHKAKTKRVRNMVATSVV